MTREIEISDLDLRYEDYRMKNPEVEAKLLSRIAQRGIEEPLEGVELQESLVLLDGFKRYRCARKLQIHTAPFISLGNEEGLGIMKLLRAPQTKALSILEQARFIDQLATVCAMCVAQIAEELSRSKAWVSMRLGLIGEMSPAVAGELFAGRFLSLFLHVYFASPYAHERGERGAD